MFKDGFGPFREDGGLYWPGHGDTPGASPQEVRDADLWMNRQERQELIDEIDAYINTCQKAQTKPRADEIADMVWWP